MENENKNNDEQKAKEEQERKAKAQAEKDKLNQEGENKTPPETPEKPASPESPKKEVIEGGKGKELDLTQYKRAIMVVVDEHGLVQVIPIKGVNFRYEAKGIMAEALDNYGEQRIIVNVDQMIKLATGQATKDGKKRILTP